MRALATAQLLVLSFAVAACGHPRTPEPHGGSVKGAPASAAVACPSQDFGAFLEAFAESKDIQRAFTKYPLETQHLDLNAQPEPTPVKRSLEAHQLDFPVIPNQIERAGRSLSLRVDQLASRQATLTLMKNDTDYAVSYFFSRDSCWELVRIEDWSL